MRNVKVLNTQDHVMIFIETDEEETEITCIPSSSGNRVFPDSFTAITLE